MKQQKTLSLSSMMFIFLQEEEEDNSLNERQGWMLLLFPLFGFSSYRTREIQTSTVVDGGGERTMAGWVGQNGEVDGWEREVRSEF